MARQIYKNEIINLIIHDGRSQEETHRIAQIDQKQGMEWGAWEIEVELVGGRDE